MAHFENYTVLEGNKYSNFSLKERDYVRKTKWLTMHLEKAIEYEQIAHSIEMCFIRCLVKLNHKVKHN